MASRESLLSEMDPINPITSFRNFGGSHIMTRDEATELLFTLSDKEDDSILKTMESIVSGNETYIDDFTFYCAWELVKVDKHGNGASDDCRSWIEDACRTCCSRCRVKKQNFEYICVENGKLLHWCLSCRKKVLTVSRQALVHECK